MRLVIITVSVQQIQTEVFLFWLNKHLNKMSQNEVKQAETIVNTGLIFDNMSA